MQTSKPTEFLTIIPISTDPLVARRYLISDKLSRGNVRFGRLLESLDKVAENCALEYVHQVYPGARVVTAAIDNITIRELPDMSRGDILCSSIINHVGRSSMEVGIRVEQLASGTRFHIASAYFTMVARAMDGSNLSLQLPELEIATELQQRRFEKATTRRQEYRELQDRLLKPPSIAEYQMLRELHTQPSCTPNYLVSEFSLESHARAYPEVENVPTTVFGGYLIRRAYELASLTAELLPCDRIIPVRVNRINFHSPVFLGDRMRYRAKIVYTSGSYITILSNIERLTKMNSLESTTNSCLFTFQNVDSETFEPLAVPSVFPTNYEEDALYLQAYRQDSSLPISKL